MLLTRRCGFSAACYPVAPTPRREFDTVFDKRPAKLALYASHGEVSHEANRVPGGSELGVRAGRERPTT
jgi:hypothetical protein